jgi:transposase
LLVGRADFAADEGQYFLNDAAHVCFREQACRFVVIPKIDGVRRECAKAGRIDRQCPSRGGKAAGEKFEIMGAREKSASRRQSSAFSAFSTDCWA